MIRRTIATLAIGTVITGCAAITELFTGKEDKKAYQHATTTEALEVPPDLLTPAIEKGLLVPGEEESVSQYSSVRASQMADQGDTSGSVKKAEVTRQTDGSSALTIFKSFNKAWRDIEIAASVSGDIEVEDRDRSGGLFYIRYTDPDAPEPGLFSWLAFWRSEESSKLVEYRLKLDERSDEATVVTVLGATESRVESLTKANKVLETLRDTLK